MTSDLGDTERRIYLSYFNDGIADIMAGLPILTFGLGMVFDSTMLFMFTWLPTILFWPLKRALTFPRMGYVRFAPERQKKISNNLILLLVAGVVALVIGVVAFMGTRGVVFSIRAFMVDYDLLIVGAIMALAFVLIALLFEIRRFYAYGVLVFGAWLLARLLDVEAGGLVASAGGMIVLIGVGLLANFLAKYPLPSE